MWDVSLPADRALDHKHPDIILTLKESNTIEMACCYDSLLEEREKEKQQKYEELAADIALQFLGHKVKSVPLVIGDLGSIGSWRSHWTVPNSSHQRVGSSPVLHADKGILYLSTRISETAPFRMSLAHWIKQFPVQVPEVDTLRGESHQHLAGTTQEVRPTKGNSRQQ